MEWIGASVLAIVVGALATMLFWVSWAHEQRAGLWWAAAGTAVALDGIITLANSPSFLVPFARDAIGPTAAWLFYCGANSYADRTPQPWAAGAAIAGTAGWFGLHYFGPPGSTFYASALAEFPLMFVSALMISRVAETTMSRLFAGACAFPVLLVVLNPPLKSLDFPSAVWAQIWLVTLCPVVIFATCVFLERSLAKQNRVLEESGAQLRRYRTQLEEIVAQRTAELETSQQRLRSNERLASIGTLTAGLAHQVNNPVGSIMAAAGFAKLTRGENDELETLRRAVVDIEQEAARCGEIVRDMLRFASDRPTDKKVIAIDSILEQTRHAVRRLEREREATLTIEFDGPSPLVCASAIELEQAITNVVENALQSKSKAAHVRIERSTNARDVTISVEDDGCGIAEADLVHVLDPFFTSRLEAGGTGLGLSVAHGIAQEHGGSLTVDSEVGRGTTVVLTLPKQS